MQLQQRFLPERAGRCSADAIEGGGTVEAVGPARRGKGGGMSRSGVQEGNYGWLDAAALIRNKVMREYECVECV